MGQRQSSPQQQSSSADNNSQSDNNNSSDSRRGRVIRPSARLNVERTNPLSRSSAAAIPVNENQRRDERRTRRARLREQQLNGEENSNSNNTDEEQQQQQHRNEEAAIASLMSTVSEAIDAVNAARPSQSASSTSANNGNNSTEGPASTVTPFSRMIAQVISEAVVASFRNGQIPPAVPSNNENRQNVRQQLTMHLSPELFQQMEPESTEDTFMRFMRLPVIVTSISTPNGNNTDSSTSTGTETPSTAVNADGEAPTLTEGESEVTRIMTLPVFLYGMRASAFGSEAAPATPTATTGTANDEGNGGEATPVRQSARIRERMEREQQQEQASPSRNNNSGQWTVYIISGNSVENMMNDSPSYEELLDLAALIGPARRPTVSQEAIDNYVPIVKYTSQVKQTILGNSEGCQVCLNSYQSEDDVRVLACHHGFHKDCIDKWLTEGQNQCPLCRGVPIPTSSSSPPSNQQ